MAAQGLETRPVVIERYFGRAWAGRPISKQAVSAWLNGKAIPSQERLRVLAEWLHVEPQVLRFGEAAARAVREYQQRWDEMQYAEREVVDAYLCLPAKQRMVVREVVLAFAKAYPKDGGGDAD